MIAYNVKNSVVFNEFSDKKQKEWFDFKQKNFLGHIDTFYYTLYVDADWNENENKIKLCNYLRDKKTFAEISKESVSVFENISDKMIMHPYFSAGFYKYHIGIKNKFDVFIAETVPNVNTPSFIVQLRSQALWLDGVRASFNESVEIIEAILKSYNLKIKQVRENRVDYAFHNNYIQDFIHFFPEKYLGEMIVANFSGFGEDGSIRFHKEGMFRNSSVEIDYFTLGRRKSNNVFFRVYNKSKEVVEMGYKQFFIPMWFDKGLISKYDMYVLERAFKYGTWSARYKARCEFYYDYGSDLAVRQNIYDMLCCPDTKMSDYKKIAEQYTPDITLVTNVEFQTKRKFYDRLPVDLIKLSNDENFRSYMYDFLEQVPSLINFLTNETLRFVNYKGKFKTVRRSDRPVADWWERLRRCRQLELDSNLHIDYYRKYQLTLDIERSKYMTLNKIARHSAYYGLNRDDDNATFYDDLCDYLSSLNDNDLIRYYNLRRSDLKDKKQKFEKIRGCEDDAEELSE